jgi:hypothetical protein
MAIRLGLSPDLTAPYRGRMTRQLRRATWLVIAAICLVAGLGRAVTEGHAGSAGPRRTRRTTDRVIRPDLDGADVLVATRSGNRQEPVRHPSIGWIAAAIGLVLVASWSPGATGPSGSNRRAGAVLRRLDRGPPALTHT